MQVDKIESPLVGVVDDVVDIEVAMNVDRDRVRQSFFALDRARQQPVEAGDRGSADAAAAVPEFRMDPVDVGETFVQLPRERRRYRPIGTCLSPHRAQRAALALEGFVQQLG